MQVLQKRLQVQDSVFSFLYSLGGLVCGCKNCLELWLLNWVDGLASLFKMTFQTFRLTHQIQFVVTPPVVGVE